MQRPRAQLVSLFLLASVVMCLVASPAFAVLPFTGRPDPGLAHVAELPSDQNQVVWHGNAVAIAGGTAVVGAPYGNSGYGVARVYVKSGSRWLPQQTLVPSDPSGKLFGQVVAIDGDTIVVGAPGDDTGATDAGAAYVFTRSGGVWTQQQRLASEAPGTYYNFGCAVDVEGDTAIIAESGAYTSGLQAAGAVHVFQRTAGVWDLAQTLTAPTKSANDRFGSAVALSGDHLLSSAFGDDVGPYSDCGSAHVYLLTAGTWSHEQTLTSSAPADSDWFGYTVALEGDSALVGVPRSDRRTTDAGAAELFTRSGTTWSQATVLAPSGLTPGDLLGFSVSMDGSVAVCGAPYTQVGDYAGAGVVHVFYGAGASWSRVQTISMPPEDHYSDNGYAVDVSGSDIVFGAPQAPVGGVYVGRAHIFSGLLQPQVEVAEDSSLNVAGSVLFNDSNIDTETLIASLTVDAEHGTVALSPSGSFTYTPAANYWGPDHFHYVPGDATHGFGMATVVSLTVTPVNDGAPVAVEDSATISEDASIAVAAPGVLANDTDVDNDPLTVFSVVFPEHGTGSVAVDGSWYYTPSANFNGVDHMHYRAQDATSQSGYTTITITVTAVNDAPVASNDVTSTSEDATMWVGPPGVLANDSDADSDTLAWDSHVDPSHGELMVYAGGGYRYQPDSDFNGIDRFRYRCSDGTTASAWATVTITVTAVNDVPVAVDDTATVAEDGAIVIAAPGVLANDIHSDSDSATVLSVVFPEHGTGSVAVDGSWYYTPDPNFNGDDHMHYRSQDASSSESGLATIAITVTPVNDAPTAVDDTATVNEDAVLSIEASGVLANDSDIDGDPLTATFVASSANGSVALAADGSYTYTPAVDFSGTDHFSYRASDGALLSESATVTIVVEETSGTVSRIEGADRYAVAASMAATGWNADGSWGETTHVVVACGEPGKEADPLAAAGLAGVYDAPVLLVRNATTIPSSTRNTINAMVSANGTVTVHIVGGTPSVPSGCAANLDKLSRVVLAPRIKGGDRYEVTANIAKAMRSVTGTAAPGALVICAEKTAAFYDALAVSPVAYRSHMPMLASRTAGIPGSVRSVLASSSLVASGSPRYLVSGTTYLSATVAGQAAPSGGRLSTTTDRYLAASQIASSALAHSAWGLTASEVGVASKLSDSLGGGTFMGKRSGLFLYTTTTGSTLRSATRTWIDAHHNDITQGWVFGGAVSVPDAQKNDFQALLQ